MPTRQTFSMFFSISFFLFLNNDNISSACIKWVEWWRALNQFVWAGNHQDFGSVYTQPLQGQEKLLSMEQSPKAAPSQLHVPSESKLIKHFSKICFENYQNGRKWSYEYNLLFKRVELSEHAERLIFEPKPIKFCFCWLVNLSRHNIISHTSKCKCRWSVWLKRSYNRNSCKWPIIIKSCDCAIFIPKPQISSCEEIISFSGLEALF